MKSKLRQIDTYKKTYRIKAGLSNILVSYVLAGTIQLNELTGCNNSISSASDVIGGG